MFRETSPHSVRAFCGAPTDLSDSLASGLSRMYDATDPRTVLDIFKTMSGCECKPDAKRKRDSAQPENRAQPVIKGEAK